MAEILPLISMAWDFQSGSPMSRLENIDAFSESFKAHIPHEMAITWGYTDHFQTHPQLIFFILVLLMKGQTPWCRRPPFCGGVQPLLSLTCWDPMSASLPSRPVMYLDTAVWQVWLFFGLLEPPCLTPAFQAGRPKKVGRAGPSRTKTAKRQFRNPLKIHDQAAWKAGEGEARRPQWNLPAWKAEEKQSKWQGPRAMLHTCGDPRRRPT